MVKNWDIRINNVYHNDKLMCEVINYWQSISFLPKQQTPFEKGLAVQET